uniref:Pentatricopeptide, putative, expressed n=2 Tax=Oryza sativa subsp. japonica TaxID=39947 RepID=Q94GS5_ORYSJ|nr:hypothetical protein [Oryza sativa Japonica Group]ABF98467.1 pentatricopeptide, putative, expressed [Oryza sativa Japonica Group]
MAAGSGARAVGDNGGGGVGGGPPAPASLPLPPRHPSSPRRRTPASPIGLLPTRRLRCQYSTGSLPESAAGHAVATPRSPSRRPGADAADEGEVLGLSSAAAVWMGAQARSGCEGNAESMAVALSACPYAGDLALAKGEATHGCGVMKGVIHGYVFITNSLVCMYGKLGEMDNAKKAFRDATEKNIVTWNTLITSYATAGLCDEALDVLAQMEQIGGTVAPNVVSWSAVISGFGKRKRERMRERRIRKEE